MKTSTIFHQSCWRGPAVWLC